jgi:hypothetical protein
MSSSSSKKIHYAADELQNEGWKGFAAIVVILATLISVAADASWIAYEMKFSKYQTAVAGLQQSDYNNTDHVYTLLLIPLFCSSVQGLVLLMRSIDRCGLADVQKRYEWLCSTYTYAGLSATLALTNVATVSVVYGYNLVVLGRFNDAYLAAKTGALRNNALPTAAFLLTMLSVGFNTAFSWVTVPALNFSLV